MSHFTQFLPEEGLLIQAELADFDLDSWSPCIAPTLRSGVLAFRTLGVNIIAMLTISGYCRFRWKTWSSKLLIDEATGIGHVNISTQFDCNLGSPIIG